MRNLLVAIYEYLRIVARIWWLRWRGGNRCIICSRPAGVWFPSHSHVARNGYLAVCAWCRDRFRQWAEESN